MIREPSVAGSFYPIDAGMLHSQIEGLLGGVKSAGDVDAIGAVSPHAGYVYSGKVAAQVFSWIKPADTYVILGPNHHGMGAAFALMREGVWRTPLGEVRLDSYLAEEILKRSKHLEDDFLAHQREHSIEVQVPFIQYFKPDAQIVPVTVSHYSPGGDLLQILEDIGGAIAGAVDAVDEKVVVVASTDFSHYEPQKKAEENDKRALDAILARDPKKLLDVVREYNISMCGAGPTAATIVACNILGATKADLVEYMTSGDTTGDYAQVVGYGGVLIR